MKQQGKPHPYRRNTVGNCLNGVLPDGQIVVRIFLIKIKSGANLGQHLSQNAAIGQQNLLHIFAAEQLYQFFSDTLARNI